MSKPKHTPGPWKAERDTARNAYAWKVTGAKGVVEDIARLALVDSVSQIEANAHLIAAAPTMYEALKAMLSQVKHIDQSATHEGLTNCDIIAKARVALAQAEGRHHE